MLPDWLALVGASADGIPGLPGFGAKSASALLSLYGNIDAIPDEASAWDVKVRGAARLAETLRAQRANALLYRELATLRTDVPLPETAEQLRWNGVDDEALSELAGHLGDFNLRIPPVRPRNA